MITEAWSSSFMPVSIDTPFCFMAYSSLNEYTPGVVEIKSPEYESYVEPGRLPVVESRRVTPLPGDVSPRGSRSVEWTSARSPLAKRVILVGNRTGTGTEVCSRYAPRQSNVASEVEGA